MNKKFDQLLHDSLRPTNEPDPELNRRILDRRLKGNMRKWNMKKSAAAAAIGILVMAGGVTAYAATQNFSLLSLFSDDSREVKDEAARLLDRNVTQDKADTPEQSEWVSFEIREAILDRNKVLVQVAAKPVDPAKYLLVPDSATEQDSVMDLEMDGLTGDQTIAEYAKSQGKQCVMVGAGIDCEAGSQSISNHTEADGTLVFVIEFNNEEKTKNPEYVCRTAVRPAGQSTLSKGEINFTLTDKSDVKVVKYVPVSDGTVEGTKLIVDSVTFEKSNLEMMCKVEYHYPGKESKMRKTKDDDICFFLLDSDGNIIESRGGGGTTMDEADGITKLIQNWEYDLQKLPDIIKFRAKDVFEKDLYGTIAVKRVR